MLEKKTFFEKYQVERAFETSELSWPALEEIYDDYSGRLEETAKVCRKLERFLKKQLRDGSYHSMTARVKTPEHLIEKIIRKRGVEHNHKYRDISASNYREILRDLIGVRILVFAKEEWEEIFDSLTGLFPMNAMSGEGDRYMAEQPRAYTRYGDRDIFKNKIYAEHSNKGYRSQHYIVYFRGYYCEIQVRTLLEEVYGEFDHKVKYPYRDHNQFLVRYTNTISQMLDAADELISSCFQMAEPGWEACGQYYADDKYIDWMNISQQILPQEQIEKATEIGNMPEKSAGEPEAGKGKRFEDPEAGKGKRSEEPGTARSGQGGGSGRIDMKRYALNSFLRGVQTDE